VSMRRIVLVAATICFSLSETTMSAVAGPSSDASADPRGNAVGGSVCAPGNLIEARSEGAWYPAVVLDPLRDGRCFVHYDGYGSDDDEALGPSDIRSRR